MRLSALAVTAVGFTQSAVAACGSQDVSVFSCTVREGAKQVEICAGPDGVHYAFGATTHTPELALQTSITALEYTPWNGIGRSIYEQVIFRNAGHDYTIYSAFDRMTLEPEQQLEGAIVVSKNDQELATLRCDPGTVRAEFDALYGLKHNAGQCWNFDKFAWTTECSPGD